MATSRSLNKVMLIGNISRDPVVKYTPNGSLVCTFGIATNTSWTDSSGEQKEMTEWHNIVAWNKLGEICANLLSKGMLIYVEGELRTRRWKDDSDKDIYRTEIKISEMKLLDDKGRAGVGIENASENSGPKESGSDSNKDKESASEDTSSDSNDNSSETEDVPEEELPF